MSTCGVYTPKPESSLWLYRAFTPKNGTRCKDVPTNDVPDLGRWWAFFDPNESGLACYRQLVVLCPEWRLSCVERCRVKSEATLNVGPGRDLVCKDSQLRLAGSNTLQVWIADVKAAIEPGSCTVEELKP